MTNVLRVHIGCLMVVWAGSWSAAAGASPRARLEWRFQVGDEWAGWTPSAQIRDVRFDAQSAEFRATGGDPQIMSPPFDLAPATNLQWVEIDLECAIPGEGELFYTNKTTGQYGGLEPAWMARVVIPSAGRQTLQVWPFWEGLGRIIRLRFDPPDGSRCKLYAIRVMESSEAAPSPVWSFDASDDSWRSMHASRLERAGGALHFKALRPQAMIITPVAPFEAARRSLLRLEVDYSGPERVIGFYWVSKQHPGLMGQPVWLRDPPLAEEGVFDLRRFPMWQGTITHLAIAFSTSGDETLTLRHLSIEPNDPASPRLRIRYLGFDRPINRANASATVKMVVEHAGGPVVPAGRAVIAMEGGQRDAACPAIKPGEQAVIAWPVRVGTTNPFKVRLTLNGQTFTAGLRVDPPLDGRVPAGPPVDYAVPPPRPVRTPYSIGIYYFPGWSPDDMSRWEKQRGFPEREPVLGWYAEGDPEVADWHIKWAVENGLSFFVYDWYWRNGREELGAGLNEGFLKARYNGLLNFAVMWANHKPFSGHTLEQLLDVTDYWVAHYLRKPNYLRLDGKPYVSFFSPGELIADLGSPEKTRAALEAMRGRARAAGLPGLHIAACSGPDRPAMEVLKNAGFDSATAYNYIRTGAPVSHSTYRQFLMGHETFWTGIQKAGVLPYVPLLGVGWDARPWHGPRTEQKFARATRDFAEALRRLKANLDSTGGKTAILEAWNEWGEGSYIEPNAEFGFGDLEAIREIFAEPGDFPVNIGPDDLGMAGRYDLRLRSSVLQPAGSAAAKRVPLAGVHPAVRKGMMLTCRSGRIELAAGEARSGDQAWTTLGAELVVPPAQILPVTGQAITLVDGPVSMWHGGNRLRLGREGSRNVLPGSFMPGTLQLRDLAVRDRVLGDAQVVNLDEQWAAFSLKPEGGLKAGQKVAADFHMGLRRVDALVLDLNGRPRLISGKPAPDCPLVPEVPKGALHLANVYRPFRATGVEPEQVYVIRASAVKAPPAGGADALMPVLKKLRAGRHVAIVCWGDSVTACGESSSAKTCYVGLLEAGLMAKFPKAALQVINAGIGGSSTPGRLPNFQKEVLDHKPDVVTLEFVNDMGVPIAQLRPLYAEILRRTRSAGAALVIITPHFVMPSWMNLPPSGRGEDTRPGVAFLREFARENQVPLADAAARWQQLEAQGLPYEILLMNGINHPDDRGHAIFAEELLRLFE